MKPSRQFSRRHHTDDAHRAAQANRQARLELKQLLIDEQVARTAARTPEQIEAQRARKAKDAATKSVNP